MKSWVGRLREPVLFLALLGLAQCELFVPALRADYHGPKWVNVVLLTAFTIPVVLRRRAPLRAFLVYAVVANVWLDSVYGADANLPVEPLVVLLILTYSAAAHATRRDQRYVLAAVAMIFLTELVLLLVGRKSVGNAVPGLVMIGGAYLLGRVFHDKHAAAVAFQQEAAAARAQSEQRAREAVRGERARIARELHDVIAHHVSVMVVQAGAAERLLGADPTAAMDALAAIRHSGAEAIDELRRLLGLLRDEPRQHAPTEPQPSLHRIEQLLESERSAGLEVAYAVDGERRDLPDGIELAAYRIVQEALTNVRKHSQASAAQLRVRYGARELELVITNAGVLPPLSDGHQPGQGIIGMRERVSLYGGTVDAGRSDGQDFLVRARMPIPEQS